LVIIKQSNTEHVAEGATQLSRLSPP